MFKSGEKKNENLPGGEEEQGDGCTLSDVGGPGRRDRTTDDDTVWVIDLAEFVCSENYGKKSLESVKIKKHVKLCLKRLRVDTYT